MLIVQCKNCGTRNRVDEVRLAGGEAQCGHCKTRLDASNNAKPTTITDATFRREILEASGPPTLVDCWAPWCGPCRVIAPILDQLAKEASGRYRIAKLNVDENPVTASEYQIASIPTMLIFKNGKLVDRLIGAHPKQTIAQRLIRAV